MCIVGFIRMFVFHPCFPRKARLHPPRPSVDHRGSWTSPGVSWWTSWRAGRGPRRNMAGWWFGTCFFLIPHLGRMILYLEHSWNIIMNTPIFGTCPQKVIKLGKIIIPSDWGFSWGFLPPTRWKIPSIKGNVGSPRNLWGMVYITHKNGVFGDGLLGNSTVPPGASNIRPVKWRF